MALIGGGGAPNVSGGSNPSGTGTGLSFIGNHAYAYSGIIGVNNVETKLLKDNMPTGGYFVGNIQFSYANTDGDDMFFFVKINGQIAFQIETEQASTYTTMPQNVIPVILAPQDTIELSALNGTGSISRDVCAKLTGEMIYA